MEMSKNMINNRKPWLRFDQLFLRDIVQRRLFVTSTKFVLAINRKKPWEFFESFDHRFVSHLIASMIDKLNAKYATAMISLVSKTGCLLAKVKISASALALGVQCDSINHVSRYRVL